MIPAGRRHIVYGSRSDEIRLWNFADLHHGNRGVAHDKLKADIQRVKDDPYSFFMLGGDMIEAIGYRDKRFDPEILDEAIPAKDLGALGVRLMSDVRDMFKPVAHKCIGVMDGNHETVYQIATEQQHLVHWLCVELGVPYMGYSCFFDLVFVRKSRVSAPTLLLNTGKPHKLLSNVGDLHCWSVRFFAHHGAGYAQTPGGKLNKLIQFMDYFQADVTFIAHIHDQEAKRLVRLRADDKCEHLVDIPQLGIVTGSYLRTYAEGPAGYGEKKGYRPVPLGAVAAKFTPDKHDMHAEI